MLDNAVVVDASALASLLFGETPGQEVAERLEGHVLYAPTLLRYELASVCRKKVLEVPERQTALLFALRLFRRLGVKEVQVPPEGLLEVALETSLTVYDAAYLWLSRELSLPLVTLDTGLRRAEKRD